MSPEDFEKFDIIAHNAAERRLDQLEAALYDGEADMPEELAGPFCGCNTCIVREVLHAAWPTVMEGAREIIAREVESVRKFGMEDCTIMEAAALIRFGGRR